MRQAGPSWRARRRSRRIDSRGASLVEFALIVPLLSMFLFGIVQFGIAYDKQQSINSAAREGARLGALDSSDLVSISQRAADSYDASAAAGQDPTIVVRDDGGNMHGVYCGDDGNYYVSYVEADCTSGSNMSNADANDETQMPCGEATPSAYVSVTASTPYDITIPFWGVQSVTLDAEAQFRCE